MLPGTTIVVINLHITIKQIQFKFKLFDSIVIVPSHIHSGLNIGVIWLIILSMDMRLWYGLLSLQTLTP